MSYGKCLVVKYIYNIHDPIRYNYKKDLLSYMQKTNFNLIGINVHKK